MAKKVKKKVIKVKKRSSKTISTKSSGKSKKRFSWRIPFITSLLGSILVLSLISLQNSAPDVLGASTTNINPSNVTGNIMCAQKIYCPLLSLPLLNGLGCQRITTCHGQTSPTPTGMPMLKATPTYSWTRPTPRATPTPHVFPTTFPTPRATPTMGSH